MRVMRLMKPGGIEKLVLGQRDAQRPAPHEIQVRISACSLNYHDLYVLKGYLRTQDGRVPLSDGAGEVIEVGSAVDLFKPGDRVVSLFFQQAGQRLYPYPPAFITS